jgi:hypothetical protein
MSGVRFAARFPGGAEVTPVAVTAVP